MIALVIITSIATAITLGYATYQWLKRKEEVKRLTRNRKKEAKANNVAFGVSIASTILASTIAIYSILQQGESDRENNNFQQTLKKKSDSLKNATRELQNASLEITEANKTIIELQNSSLEKSKEIIEKQESAITSSLEIIKLQKESLNEITGRGNKPIVSHFNTYGLLKRAKYSLLSVSNIGTTNIRNLQIFVIDRYKNVANIISHNSEKREIKCVSKEGDTMILSKYNSIYLDQDINGAYQIPINGLASGETKVLYEIRFPIGGHYFSYGIFVRWDGGSYHVELKFCRDNEGNILLLDQTYIDNTSTIIENPQEFFGTSKYYLLKISQYCGKIKGFGLKDQIDVYWSPIFKALILYDKHWLDFQMYRYRKVNSKSEALIRASDIESIINNLEI